MSEGTSSSVTPRFTSLAIIKTAKPENDNEVNSTGLCITFEDHQINREKGTNAIDDEGETIQEHWPNTLFQRCSVAQTSPSLSISESNELEITLPSVNLIDNLLEENYRGQAETFISIASRSATISVSSRNRSTSISSSSNLSPATSIALLSNASSTTHLYRR